MGTRRSGARLATTMLRAVVLTLLVGGVILSITAALGAMTGSSDMTYTSVKYNATVKDNGDIRILQRVTMRLDGRSDDDDNSIPWRQLFQRYSKNQIGGDITDITVSDDQGNDYEETDPLLPSSADNRGIDWDAQMARTWYLDESPSDAEKGTVEIGWNIPTTYSADSLTFTLGMTFEGAVTKHPDVATFQWEPISTANEVPVEYVEGTLHFPDGITTDSSWAWLHYESDSTTARGENGSLHFTASNVAPGKYLDVRAMFDADAMPGSPTDDTAVKDSIIAEETAKETEWDEGVRRNAAVRLTVWILVALVLLILIAYNIYYAWRTHRGSQYRGEMEYWREPPPMSPAAAARLLAVMEPTSKTSANALSATILSLASKKAIGLLPGNRARYMPFAASLSGAQMSAEQLSAIASAANSPTNGAPEKTTTIVLLPRALMDPASLHLSASETSALNALKAMSHAEGAGQFFDLEEIKKLLKKDTSAAKAASQHINRVSTSGDAEFDHLHAVDTVWRHHNTPITILLVASAATIAYFGLIGQLLLALILGGISLFAAFVCEGWGSNKVLNKTGQLSAGKVQGLRNYLLDFSTFQDRGVLDLALWDRYLVYAAAFGISRQVVEQLAIAAPQISDQQWLDSNAMMYPLLYSIYRPLALPSEGALGSAASGFTGFGNGFSFADIGGQLSSNLGDLQSTVNSALSSGSSGSGGGFSGGGGFGGGGGGFGGGSFGGR